MPPTHCSWVLQLWVHAPQCAKSFCKSKQLWLQAVWPAPHIGVHIPAVHTWLVPHTFPQPPQFFASVEVVTHALPHLVVPGALQVQLPLRQLLPAPQTLPQLPQLFGSKVVMTQTLLQLVWNG